MIIKDKKLGKYEIHHDGNNYSVVEETEKKDKNNKPIFKNLAYCSSVAYAIKKIAKLQVEINNSTYSLDEYIKAIKDATKEIESQLN